MGIRVPPVAPNKVVSMIDKNNQIEKAKQYASQRGGFCLSTVEDYKNNKTSLVWKCSNESHTIWKNSYSNIIHRGSWCPACRNEDIKKEKIKSMREFAQKKNGELLSIEYSGDKSPYMWKCHIKEHSSWSASFSVLKIQNTWCKECYLENRNIKQNGISKAREIAKKRNGECLSTEYINNSSTLIWKCHVKEHKPWKARLRNIVHQDQWCPECANVKNKTEHRVRLFLETYFGFELPNKKPLWNVNPKTGRLLELDGYNEEHKVAFEHDGEHHFKETVYSSFLSEEQLEIQLERDKAKKQNCKNAGVKLISIPILKYHLRYRFFPLLRHVIEHCKKQGVILSYTLAQIRIMRDSFRAFNPQPKQSNRLIKIKQDNDFVRKIKNFKTLKEILVYYGYTVCLEHKILLIEYISTYLGKNNRFAEEIKKEGNANTKKPINQLIIKVEKNKRKDQKLFTRIRQDKDFFNNLSNFETIEEILIHYQYNLKRDYKRELRKYIASHLGENHAFQKPLNGKVNYPDLATLESMIKEQGYSAVGRILGCSSNAVKKYIKRKIPSFTLKDEKR